jgi:hypothetical protein
MFSIIYYKEKIEMSFVVYNPTSGPAAAQTAMAPRLKSLQNGALGVIDNGKTNSDTVLNQIVGSLKARYSLKDVVPIRKSSASHALKSDEAEMLAQTCDLVLVGVGD